MAGELNDKQKRFCEEYVLDFNGTQAAIRAGYSAKTAKAIASENLTKPDVQNYLTQLKKIAAEDYGVSKQDLINELKKISFFDIRKIFTDDNGLKNITDFDDDSAAAVAGVETDDLLEYNADKRQKEFIGYTRKVKTNSKIAAIERLSKMLGYDAPEKKESRFTDKDGNDIPLPEIIIQTPK